jgi:hypothetical protein
VSIAAGGEWTADVAEVSGLATYAVTIVTSSAEINRSISTASLKFRCVIPLVT